MKPLSLNLLALALLLASCSHSNSPAQAQTQQKVSQFDRAGMCDFLIDKSGIYHAVFQESPEIGKPVFIYYSASANKGATWSKPVSLSNDNTGNGASNPRILQDASGKIYAVWKRYGTTKYPVAGPTMDGVGGYGFGTIFYKVLNGGAWSQPIQVNEQIGGQEAWFATVTPAGNVDIFWSQVSPEGITEEHTFWWFADYIRGVALNGTAQSAYVTYAAPTPPAYTGGFPVKKKGVMNLEGYVDKANRPHYIYEDVDSPDGVQTLKYYNAGAQRVLYSYPSNNVISSFINPPRLLVDENGNDHVIFLPSPSTLESEQVWDINLITNKTVVLTSIQQQGIRIQGMQANQGPNGQMAVTVEAGAISGSADAFAMFYNNGAWKNIGLTNNAAKSKFFSKDFVGLGGYLTNVSQLTTYRSTFASIAYDPSGRKSLLMSISGYTVGNGGYGLDHPFVTYMAIDR